MIKRLLEKLNLIKPQKPKLVISDVSIQYCEACDKKMKHIKKKYGLECNECGWLKEQY